MTWRLLPIVATGLVLAACSDEMTAPLDGVSGSISSGFGVIDVEPSAAAPGTLVRLTGQGFTKDMQLVWRDVVITDWTLLSSDSLTFVMPEATPGSAKLRLQKPGSQFVNVPMTLTGKDGTATVDPNASANYKPCESVGQTECIATAKFPAGSSAPAPAPCSRDGEMNCVTTEDYKAARMAGFSAADVKGGVGVAGLVGTAVLQTYAPCAAGGSDCLTLSANGLVAAEGSLVTSQNIRKDVTIAGVLGEYPSATYPLPSAGVGLALLGMDSNMTPATYEWWDQEGVHRTGSVLSPSGAPIMPGTATQTFGASYGLYGAFEVQGDGNLDASKIKNGVSLFNVMGTFAQDCSIDGEMGCRITTDGTWRAANIGGWNADGWDFRDKPGHTIAGIGGKLEYRKSAADSTLFSPSDVTYATVDEYFNGSTFGPRSAPFGAVFVGKATHWRNVGPGGRYADATDCDADTDDCVFQDMNTGLMWTEQNPAAGTKVLTTKANFSAAVSRCDQLNFLGHGDWRLPTQKEAMQAYIDGFADVVRRNPKFGDLADMALSPVWTETAYSSSTSDRWQVGLVDGFAHTVASSIVGSGNFVCVR